MAIKIPSKNIYSIENPKIRNNAIDNISVEYNKVAPLNEFDKIMLVDKHDISDFGYPPSKQQEDLRAITAPYTGSTTTVARAVAYVLVETYYKSITSYIPTTKDNYYVSKLLTGNDKSGNPNISYNIVGYELNGTSSGKVDIGQGILVEDYKVYDLSRSGRVYGDLQILSLPNLDEPFTQDASASASITQTVTASVDFDNESTISVATATKEIIDNIEYYVITIKYLASLRVTKLSGNVSNLPTNIDYTLTLSGEYTEYYPTSIEISFYGNTIGISTEDNTIVIGNASGSKPLKIQGNELMQNSSDITNKYTDTLEAYQNGKETVTLRCDIDDYYDYNSGEKSIGANSHQLLDSNNYIELYNSNYQNGVVNQLEKDNYGNILQTFSNIISNNTYIKNIDTIFSSYNIGDICKVYYTINNNQYSVECIIQEILDVARLEMVNPTDPYTNEIVIDGVGVLSIYLNATLDSYGETFTIGNGSCVVLRTSYSTPYDLTIDKIVYNLFQVQGYKNGNVVVDTLGSQRQSLSNKEIIIPFRKDKSFDQIRFKLNGKTIDTGILYNVEFLENDKDYTFSARLIDDLNVIWDNMQIIYGKNIKPYEKYLPMTLQLYDEIIPMKYTISGEDIPLSYDLNGNPKVFKVLGVKLSSKGKVFQEIYAQEA